MLLKQNQKETLRFSGKWGWIKERGGGEKGDIKSEGVDAFDTIISMEYFLESWVHYLEQEAEDKIGCH